MNSIGFIGAGQMAQALAAGIATANHKSVQFFISDPSDVACKQFETAIDGVSAVSRCDDNQEVVSSSEIVFVAVKPQFIESALDGLDFASTTPLVVSVVAGVMIFQLQRMTKIERLIRVMPNTPCLIGQGACAIATDGHQDADDIQCVQNYLTSVGEVVIVDESLMDSVTGLSGSGPAYVFNFIESLIDGAVLTGMPRATARTLAIKTVIGAARLVEQTGEHPAVLRDKVTSPGGTTIEGLKALEESSFRDAVMSAVQAATQRSKELGD